MAGGVHAGNVEDVFTYHAPDAAQQVALQNVRAHAKALVEVILFSTPPCADQQAAIRKIREGVMTANAAIVLRGQI